MAQAAHPRRRWFRLTPGWLPVVLLAVEGFLLLSERFRWFAFNEHKGWRVLIAVASAASVLVLMSGWFAVTLLFRLRFQFSVRSLLVLTVAVAVPCSWLLTEMEKARRQSDARQEILKLSGHVPGYAGVMYDYEFDEAGQAKRVAEPPGPAWLRSLLGVDFFAAATYVSLDNIEAKDGGWTAQPGRLADPEGWWARECKFVDDGLQHLKGLTQLRWLYLSLSMVTDDGLQHLKGLSQLELLWLRGTQVTDTGLEYLRCLTQLRELSLDNTKVTDAGLKHLEGLTELQHLSLNHTKVTDAGVKKLQQALPKCAIDYRT
jgi:hypothetical protein